MIGIKRDISLVGTQNINLFNVNCTAFKVKGVCKIMTFSDKAYGGLLKVHDFDEKGGGGSSSKL